MFSGRSRDAQGARARADGRPLASELGLIATDIEITIFESPRENWGIRGQHGDELVLNYKVEI